MAAVHRFVYRGGDRDIIPVDATHFTIHDSITVIPAGLFRRHPNIMQLICHDGVIIIEDHAFYECPRLKRVFMPGVKKVGKYSFYGCSELVFVRCPKLEIILAYAFLSCISLRSMNLKSVKVVGESAFSATALKEVELGNDLERVGDGAFSACLLLERIKIPLKDGLIPGNFTFASCSKLIHVDLVEAAFLYETIAALLMEEWRDDMNSEIDAINQNLPLARAGSGFFGAGEKAGVIRDWMSRVLRKILYYKAQHRWLVNEGAATLQLVLPCDIVMNNVISFLELPPHTFEGEIDGEEYNWNGAW